MNGILSITVLSGHSFYLAHESFLDFSSLSALAATRIIPGENENITWNERIQLKINERDRWIECRVFNSQPFLFLGGSCRLPLSQLDYSGVDNEYVLLDNERMKVGVVQLAFHFQSSHPNAFSSPPLQPITAFNNQASSPTHSNLPPLSKVAPLPVSIALANSVIHSPESFRSTKPRAHSPSHTHPIDPTQATVRPIEQSDEDMDSSFSRGYGRVSPNPVREQRRYTPETELTLKQQIKPFINIIPPTPINSMKEDKKEEPTERIDTDVTGSSDIRSDDPLRRSDTPPSPAAAPAPSPHTHTVSTDTQTEKLPPNSDSPSTSRARHDAEDAADYLERQSIVPPPTFPTPFTLFPTTLPIEPLPLIMTSGTQTREIELTNVATQTTPRAEPAAHPPVLVPSIANLPSLLGCTPAESPTAANSSLISVAVPPTPVTVPTLVLPVPSTHPLPPPSLPASAEAPDSPSSLSFDIHSLSNFTPLHTNRSDIVDREREERQRAIIEQEAERRAKEKELKDKLAAEALARQQLEERVLQEAADKAKREAELQAQIASAERARQEAQALAEQEKLKAAQAPLKAEAQAASNSQPTSAREEKPSEKQLNDAEPAALQQSPPSRNRFIEPDVQVELKGRFKFTIVRVHSAINLSPVLLYNVQIRFQGGHEQKTKITYPQPLLPDSTIMFNQPLQFTMDEAYEIVTIELFNSEKRTIADSSIRISNLDLSGEDRDYSLLLHDQITKLGCKISLRIEWDGVGLPLNSLASTTHYERLNKLDAQSANNLNIEKIGRDVMGAIESVGHDMTKQFKQVVMFGTALADLIHLNKEEKRNDNDEKKEQLIGDEQNESDNEETAPVPATPTLASAPIIDENSPFFQMVHAHNDSDHTIPTSYPKRLYHFQQYRYQDLLSLQGSHYLTQFRLNSFSVIYSRILLPWFQQQFGWRRYLIAWLNLLFTVVLNVGVVVLNFIKRPDFLPYVLVSTQHSILSWSEFLLLSSVVVYSFFRFLTLFLLMHFKNYLHLHSGIKDQRQVYIIEYLSWLYTHFNFNLLIFSAGLLPINWMEINSCYQMYMHATIERWQVVGSWQYYCRKKKGHERYRVGVLYLCGVNLLILLSYLPLLLLPCFFVALALFCIYIKLFEIHFLFSSTPFVDWSWYDYLQLAHFMLNVASLQNNLIVWNRYRRNVMEYLCANIKYEEKKTWFQIEREEEERIDKVYTRRMRNSAAVAPLSSVTIERTSSVASDPFNLSTPIKPLPSTFQTLYSVFHSLPTMLHHNIPFRPTSVHESSPSSAALSHVSNSDMNALSHLKLLDGYQNRYKKDKYNLKMMHHKLGTNTYHVLKHYLILSFIEVFGFFKGSMYFITMNNDELFFLLRGNNMHLVHKNLENSIEDDKQKEIRISSV